MKILGHPIHLMLIHFPSALLPMECVCYGLFYYTGKLSFAEASYYAMLGAVITGWLAVVFGAMDVTKISAEKPKVMAKALIHGSINTTVLIAYSIFAWFLFKKYPMLPNATVLVLSLKIGLITLMIIGNFLGGSLVLKDKIGIEN
ncbi:MAG TPA: DUF2231 domain-containing protein [Bacteroidia bacterium]|jgi:uncharacterized membrane protein|nr:DUF2231 domain-containing protein [Bacteroidia bacterium]